MRALPLPLAVTFVLLLAGLAGCLGDNAGPDPVADPPSDEPEPAKPTGGLGEAASVGRWLPAFEGEVPAISMALMHTGEVVYFSGVEAGITGDGEVLFFTEGAQPAEARVLDLSGDTPTVKAPELPEEMGDLFCSGLVHLPDGRLLVAGGTKYNELPDDTDVPPLDGTRDVRIFDPETRNWSKGDDLLLARWYPSVFQDADGLPIAASGFGNMVDSSTLWRDWERFDDGWTGVPGIDQTLPLYPRLFTVPGGPFAGQAFYTTAATLWGPSGYHQEEAGWNNHYTYELGTGKVHDHGLSTFGARQYASSVMLPVRPDEDYRPTFLTTGGTVNRVPYATALTEIVDMGTDPPTKSQGPDMLHARWFHNSVLLPDDQVAVIGGGELDNVVLHGIENTPILEAEAYDPATGDWQEWAAMDVPRMYHSSAILLPDGRVLAGGHVPLPNFFQAGRDTVNPQIVETRLQIFEPPYLFRGERPVIQDGPQKATYGESLDITVDLPDATDLAHAVLMRAGATTHAYDSGQRAIHLEATTGNGAVTVTMPPNGAVAQPGWYMLFVASTHDDGPVPSEAHWVHLDG